MQKKYESHSHRLASQSESQEQKKNSLMQQRQPTITNGPRLAIDTQLIMNIARPFCVWLACLLASASPTYLM